MHDPGIPRDFIETERRSRLVLARHGSQYASKTECFVKRNSNIEIRAVRIAVIDPASLDGHRRIVGPPNRQRLQRSVGLGIVNN